MTEPGGQNPNEKYMLDEITINGIGSPSCVPFATNYGTGLAGQNGIPTLTVSAPPKFGANINVMASNSSGSSTQGLVVVGTSSASIPFRSNFWTRTKISRRKKLRPDRSPRSYDPTLSWIAS